MREPGDSLRVLQDKLDDLNDPYRHMNLRELADYAGAGNNFHYGADTVDWIALKAPHNSVPPDDRAKSLIDQIARLQLGCQLCFLHADIQPVAHTRTLHFRYR